MLQKESFELAGANGKVIKGDYTLKEGGSLKATIIFVHGFKGFKDWGAHHLLAKFFADNDFRYLKFNFSYSGVTETKPNDVSDMEAFADNTISKELADLTKVIDFNAKQFPDSPIYLIGHSRGGGIVIVTASKDERVKKIVTWSSIADFSSLWKKEQEEEWLNIGKIYVENARTKEKMPLNSTLLTDYQTHKKEFSILKAASNLHKPWLILHGDDDVNVQFSVAQELAQKQLNAKIQKIEGANHVYGATHPYPSAQLPSHLQQVAEKTLAFLI